MKPNVILLLTGLLLSFTLNAQTQQPALKEASASTVIVDTLHYYLNKFYFKTGNGDIKTYPYYRTQATDVVSAPPITFCGSKFEVPAGETVMVSGLEAYAARESGGVSQTIPLAIYLCSLDAQGMPVLPAIDSVKATLTGTNVMLVGGNFTTTAKTMTTSFAVLFRNAAFYSGDFAHLVRTSGVTNTNTVVHGSQRYSDGNGFIRYNGVFQSTRDFSASSDFGAGTDYEFMVAPRVSYSVQASQILPQGVISATDAVTVPDTMCTRTEITFTNTSSPFFEHRMYNLNQFYRKWNLYDPFPESVKGAFAQDSSITWNFEFYEGKPESRVFLPYVNNHTIMAVTDSAIPNDCYKANEFRARLKRMSAFGRGAMYIYNESFKVCFKYCNGDAVGISSADGNKDLTVYPNPLVNGKVTITGLQAQYRVSVYNMMGQVIINESCEHADLLLDLSEQPPGTYVVRISGNNGENRMLKLIKQD